MGVLNAPQLRSHVPLLGRKTGVQISLLPLGIRTAPIDQILYIGGYLGTFTITTVVSTSSYVAVVAGATYPVVAGASDTQKSVAYQLMDLINAGTATTGVSAQNIRNTTGSIWVFDLYKPDATFTLAATGTTTPADVTVSAVAGNTTAIAKGATSIAVLAALRGDIQKDQFLQALSDDGTEYLIKMAATATAGATSLSVAALDEAIPAGSQIGFPVEFFDRTEANTSQSIDSSDYITFNSGGQSDGVATQISNEGTLGGNFYERCPGFNTAAFASGEGREVWLKIIDPPFRDGWSRRVTEGAATILGAERERTAEGFVTNSLSYKFRGKITETPAAPLY